MAKIFIEICTPGNGKDYEFVFDDSIKVYDLLNKLMAEISGFENGGISFDKESSYLFSPAQSTILPSANMLRECGVRSGERLILV